jgi:hypothetical protein
MRLKLTLVLLLANLAVFFALWRLDRSAQQTAPAHGPLMANMSNLDKIEISGRALSEERTLTRDASGKWRIVKPVDWPANEFEVQKLISQLNFLEQNVKPFSADALTGSGQTLKDFGLEDPALKLQVTAGTRSAQLFVGTPTPAAGGLYVMNPADRMIWVVPLELLQDLLMPLDDLRSTLVFSLPFFEIRGLTVRIGAPTGTPARGAGGPAGNATTEPPAATTVKVTLVKDKTDQWRFDTPIQAPANNGAVNGMIEKLATLNVKLFLSPTQQDPTRQGLTNPFMRVTLVGNTPQTLLLGDRVAQSVSAQYYAQLEGSPAIFTVDDAVFTGLQEAQDSLRERRFLDFSIAKVTDFTVQSGNQAVHIQKNETGTDPWQLLTQEASGPVPVPADTTVVTDLLGWLHDLNAVKFASDTTPTADDLKTFGLDEPQRVLTLKADKTYVMKVGVRTDPAPARYYATVEGAPFVYEIGPAILDELSLNALNYRDRTLETLSAAAQVTGLKLTNLSSNETVFNYALSPTQTTWTAVLAGEPEPTRLSVQKLEQSIHKFRIKTYLLAGFTDHYQLDAATPVPWHYRLDADIRLPGADQTQTQAKTLTFYFSERMGGSMQIGGTPQPAMIFTLPQDLIDALNVVTLSKTPPAVVQQALRQMDQPIDPRTAPTPVNGSTPPPASSPTPSPAPATGAASP